MANDVAARLKAVRQMHGLSQRELAKRAGVTNGMISLIEQGRVSPSVASLKKVLDGLPMTARANVQMATPRKKVRRNPIASVNEPASNVKMVIAGAQTQPTKAPAA